MEDIGEDLGDVFDVVVSRGARDGREVRCGIGKEGFCVLSRVMVPSSELRETRGLEVFYDNK